MVNYNDVFAVVQRFDQALATSEDATIKIIVEALAKSYANLETDLRRLHDKYLESAQPNLTGLQRSALLIQEVEQLLNLVPPEILTQLEPEMRQLIDQAAQNGSELANQLVGMINPSEIILPSTVPVEALKSAAADAMSWLTGVGAEFKITAKTIIAQGITQNKGINWTAGVLRKTLGISKRNAESIARTATLQATDAATREAYAINSIEYAQRVSAEDERVCGLCAVRAGNIYRLEDAFAIVHIRCRCYLMPVKAEWIADNLVDLTWIREHHRTTVAIA
ncbi:MAG: minor capsid protein, partial [Tolypothrix sp. T3-bin4]|nr:minor capsid protein [Tolypothrix sp. Co-bin9]MBD0302418.1 minor capsid protein [Tolypothrix sp. T3-bin4]